jgi:prolyl-tRNA synthetase
MKCLFADSDGTEKPIVMGSYGMGIERIMAAIIDRYHDDTGIVWPLSVAPFLVHIIAIDVSNDQVIGSANRIYKTLLDEGIETLIDDRDERPGFKFKDADLIGIPIHIIIGERSLREGCCEVRLRRETEKHKVKLDGVIAFVQEQLALLADKSRVHVPNKPQEKP